MASDLTRPGPGRGPPATGGAGRATARSRPGSTRWTPRRTCPGAGARAVFVRSVLPPIVFLAAAGRRLAAGLHGRASSRPTRCPAPADVAADVLGDRAGRHGALEAIWTSLSRGAVGFAHVPGHRHACSGWRCGASRWLRAAIGPIVSGLQSLPSVAWVPAAIIWFQLSDAAIYTVVLLGAVPSIANGLLTGIEAGAAAVRPGRPGARACRPSAGSGTCCSRPRCPATWAASGRAGPSPGAR